MPGLGQSSAPVFTLSTRLPATNKSCTALHELFQQKSFEQHFQLDSIDMLNGHSAEALYFMTLTTVQCCTVGEDDNRHLFSLAENGDFIWISDIAFWHVTSAAMDHVTSPGISRDLIALELRSNINLRQEVERQLLSLTSRKAPEHLLHFLNDYASSRPSAGGRPAALPMCRRDIADHPGLSVETVGRAFTYCK